MGNALKTTSLRIRGATAELKDANEDVDEFAESTSKMREQIMALSGVDIMATADSFKSTYQILQEIAGVWDTLSDVNQASLLEALAGKRNAAVVSSVLVNLKDLEGAYDSASNAAGTTAEANEIFMDSIQGHVKQLKATAEGVSKDLIDSDTAKVAVDTVNFLIKAFGTLAKFPTLMAAIITPLVVVTKNFKEMQSATVLSNTLFDGSLESATTTLTGLSKAQQQYVMSLHGLDAAQQQVVLSTLQQLSAQKMLSLSQAESLVTTGMTDAAMISEVQSRLANAAAQNQEINGMRVLTAEQIKQAVATSNLTSAKKQEVLSRLSNTEAMTQEVSKAAVAGVALKSTLATTLGKVSLAVTALSLLWSIGKGIYDWATVSLEEQQDLVENLATEYDDLTSKIQQSSDAIQEMTTRLRALETKQAIGAITDDELTELEDLERRIQLEEQLNAVLAEQEKYKKQELIDAKLSEVEKTFEKNYDGDYRQYGDISWAYGYFTGDTDKVVGEITDWYKTLADEINSSEDLERYLRDLSVRGYIAEDAVTAILSEIENSDGGFTQWHHDRLNEAKSELVKYAANFGETYSYLLEQGVDENNPTFLALEDLYNKLLGVTTAAQQSSTAVSSIGSALRSTDIPTTGAYTAEMKQAVDNLLSAGKINSEAAAAYAKSAQDYNNLVNGNVDYRNRPIVPVQVMRQKGWDISDGEMVTTYDMDYDLGTVDAPVRVKVTPITEDGKHILSQEQLDQYVFDVLGQYTTKEDILAADAAGKNLIINVGFASDANLQYDSDGLSQLDRDLAVLKQANAEAYNAILSDIAQGMYDVATAAADAAPSVSEFISSFDGLQEINSKIQSAIAEQGESETLSYDTVTGLIAAMTEAGIDYNEVLDFSGKKIRVMADGWNKVFKAQKTAEKEAIQAAIQQEEVAISLLKSDLNQTEGTIDRRILVDQIAESESKLEGLNKDLELCDALILGLKEDSTFTFTSLKDLIFDTSTAGKQAMKELESAIKTALDFRSTKDEIQGAIDKIREITGIELNMQSDAFTSQLQTISAYLDGDIKKMVEFGTTAFEQLGVQIDSTSIESFFNAVIRLAAEATGDIALFAGALRGLASDTGLFTVKYTGTYIAGQRAGQSIDVTDLINSGYAPRGDMEVTPEFIWNEDIAKLWEDSLNPPSSGGSSEDHLAAYKTEKAAIEHLREMERISTRQYYDSLAALSKKHYAALTVDIEDYRGVLEELFDLEQELYEQQQANREHAADLLANRADKSTRNMNAGDVSYALTEQIRYYEQARASTHAQKQKLLAQGVSPSSDLIQDLESAWWEYDNKISDLYDQLLEHTREFYSNFTEYADSFDLWNDVDFTKVDWLYTELDRINQLYADGLIPNAQAYNEAVQDINTQIYEEQKNSLDDIINKTMQLVEKEIRDQIEAYQEIIRLKKESLQADRDEQEYQRSIRDKTTEISKIQQKIARLKLDDSREAAAERAALEEQLAQLNTELADTQADHAYDAQVDMLDRSEQAFTESKESEIDTQTKLYNLAINRLDKSWKDMANGVSSTWNDLYRDLINANDLYGDSIDELADKWSNVTSLYNKYQGAASGGNYTESVQNGFQEDAAANGNLYNLSSSQIGQIAAMVEEMHVNSQEWHTAKQAGNTNRVNALVAENERLANQVESILKKKLYKVNGSWHIGSTSGPMLYPTFLNKYHSGGVIGGDESFKQKEMLAVFEKGEAVLDKKKQEGAYRLVDFSTTLLEKFGSAIKGVDLTHLATASLTKTKPATTTQQNQQIVFSPQIDVQISGNTGSKADAIRFGKTIADSVLGSFSEAFSKRGISVVDGLRQTN